MNSRASTSAPPEEVTGRHRKALLALLGDLKWHPTAELMAVSSHRFSARIMELRNMGHEIEKQSLDGRIFHYRLVVGAQRNLFGGA